MKKAMTTAEAAKAFDATKSQQEAVSGAVKPRYTSQIDTSGHAGNASAEQLRSASYKTFDSASDKKTIPAAGAPFTTSVGKKL